MTSHHRATMRFRTMPSRADHPDRDRRIVGEAFAESRNGHRIRTTWFPDHEALVLTARPLYLAAKEMGDVWQTA